MNTEQRGTDFVGAVTQLAIKSHSRRGFLYGLGKAGVALAAVMGGIGLVSKSALAYIPPPPDCYGSCTNCSSGCSTGGRYCAANCGCAQNNPPCSGTCDCGNFEAHGYWVSTLGGVTFHCDAIPC